MAFFMFISLDISLIYAYLQINQPDGLDKVGSRKSYCFCLSAYLDWIHTTNTLARCCIIVPTSCHLCSFGNDSSDHILVGCPYACEVLDCIFRWCGFPFPTFNLVKEMIDFAAKWGRCPIKRTVLLSVIYCSLWILWKARNDMVFNKNYSSPAKTADCIITVTFKGVKFRSNFGASNWPDWACCPPNIL